MGSIKSKTVVFVTGAFVNSSCWDEWKKYFESKGFTAYAPSWPFKDGTTSELRKRQPNDTDLAFLSLSDVIDHYSNFIKKLPEKPIVIGHSLGGCMTQVITNRDLPAAGIAIHPVPTLGVFPYEFSFLKAGWRSLGLFTPTKKTYLMSFKTWQYAFVNGMPLEEQKAAYEKFTIPESKTVARGGLTTAVKVDYKKSHPPLLILAGSKDNIIPAHLNRRNFKKYKRNGSLLEYKEFEGNNHFVLGLPSWKETANYVLNWINSK